MFDGGKREARREGDDPTSGPAKSSSPVVSGLLLEKHVGSGLLQKESLFAHEAKSDNHHPQPTSLGMSRVCSAAHGRPDI